MPPWICTAWWAIHIAASDAVSLATAASVPKRPPCFSVSPLAQAARKVSRVAASSLHFMSAILDWVIWNVPIGAPKALRSRDHCRVASYAARAMPTACEAMPMRPASSTPIAIEKPLPSSPSRFSFGST